MRAVARLAAAALLLSPGLGGASALAQLPSSPAVLDVPYLPQSVLLCGGAALAMVERWWGRRGVFAEDFAGLVRPELRGILGSDLAAAARARDWDTRIMQGTRELVREQLETGTPVIALIEVSPERYHYVVILGWQGGKVSYHDPARAPSISLDETEFLAQWNGADRWAMIVRPAPSLPPAPVVAALADTLDRPPMDSLPCRPWLDRAVDAVNQRRLEEAADFLERAGRACPDEPLVSREMAGVRFKQGRHADALRLAAGYLARAPGDTIGRQLLASSRYLTGDLEGALAEWNALGRPVVDLLRIDGAREIRFHQIAAAASAPPGSLLTPSNLALAQRRVSEVPALRRAVVGYQPVPGGLVEVRVAIVERPLTDPLWRIGAAGVARALAQQEASVDVASPTGAGELWSGSWRWAEARPRAAVRLDAPGHLLFPGVVGFEGAWERFRTGGVEDTRRSGFVGFGGWITAGLRPSAGLRIERWSTGRNYLAISAGTELWALGDRLALATTGERAFAMSAHHSYTRASFRTSWASARGLSRAAWSTRAGVEWVSARSPNGVWPVAGGAVSWGVPLRAHPIQGSALVAGPGILHGGLAADHPLARVGPVVFAAGAFVDAARVLFAGDGASRGWILDGGVGVRIGVGDGALGILRVDLARGLTDGRRSALTVGVHRSWPL